MGRRGRARTSGGGSGPGCAGGLAARSRGPARPENDRRRRGAGKAGRYLSGGGGSRGWRSRDVAGPGYPESLASAGPGVQSARAESRLARPGSSPHGPASGTRRQMREDRAPSTCLRPELLPLFMRRGPRHRLRSRPPRARRAPGGGVGGRNAVPWGRSAERRAVVPSSDGGWRGRRGASPATRPGKGLAPIPTPRPLPRTPLS